MINVSLRYCQSAVIFDVKRNKCALNIFDIIFEIVKYTDLAFGYFHSAAKVDMVHVHVPYMLLTRFVRA